MTHRAPSANMTQPEKLSHQSAKQVDLTTGRHNSPGAVFAVVALLLFTAGWATNHFATMVAVLRDQENYSSLVVNGAFGIYAVGLVPCLLVGGWLADRFGPRRVVLCGATAAALGNLLLLWWQSTGGLFLGRFIIGLGVGLAMSAGTSWAGALRGANGAVLAGIVLSAGFAVGPIASGVLAYFLPGPGAVSVPFLVTISLSAIAVLIAVFVRPASAIPQHSAAAPPVSTTQPVQTGSMRRALVTSIPMALWVFSTAAIALITLTERVGAQGGLGMLLPGLGAFIAFAAALVVQFLGRRFGWGPRAGIVGALIAAIGLILAGLGATAPPLWFFIIAAVFLGLAYGMCLREGLLDVEAYAPPAQRGMTVGIFYVFTYLGFALPVLLAWLSPLVGDTLPLLVLGGMAVCCAIIRAVQLKTGVLDRR